MNINFRKPVDVFRAGCLFFTLLFLSPILLASEQDQVRTLRHNGQSEHTFIAANTFVDNLFNALAIKLQKPIITSIEVKKRKISGEFDLTDAERVLNQITNNMSLNWFNDGRVLYIFANSEIKNKIIPLRYAPYQELKSYLQATGLYDERYPTRSGHNSGSFYVSGPPIYLELVQAAAKYLDESYQQDENSSQDIRVVRLKNTFVNDRLFSIRDQQNNIPGIANVIKDLLDDKWTTSAEVSANAAAREWRDDNHSDAADLPRETATKGKKVVEDGAFSIVAYQDSNSLLLKGNRAQVRYVEQLINTLDVAKQQIELSLWVIDVAKTEFNDLGIQWRLGSRRGNSSIHFNTSQLSAINGTNFLINLDALSRKGDAQIVSRPIILTQENVPAVFDNNTTFYTKLVGEKNASLGNVTYGTLVSVLPRITYPLREIEMVINIEDGNLAYDNVLGSAMVDGLPLVGRTKINTVARVPKNSSLLVGGYTREQQGNSESKIPLLGDIPLLGGLFRYKSDARHYPAKQISLICRKSRKQPLHTNALNRAYERADDMAMLATLFGRRRDLERKNSEGSETLSRILDDDADSKIDKIYAVLTKGNFEKQKIIAFLKSLFPDASDFLLALLELLRRKNIRKAKRKVLEEIAHELENSEQQRSIRAGINVALKARIFSSSLMKDPKALRSLYREFIMFDGPVIYIYHEWISHYDDEQREQLLEFILQSLISDMQSLAPSAINSLEFGPLLENVGKIRILYSVETNFLHKVMTLAISQCKPHLKKDFLHIFIVGVCQPEEIEKEIVTLFENHAASLTLHMKSTLIQAMIAAFSSLPLKIFISEEMRNELLDKLRDIMTMTYQRERRLDRKRQELREN